MQELSNSVRHGSLRKVMSRMSLHTDDANNLSHSNRHYVLVDSAKENMEEIQRRLLCVLKVVGCI